MSAQVIPQTVAATSIPTRPHALPSAHPNARVWVQGRLLELHELQWYNRLHYTFRVKILKQQLPDFPDFQSSWGNRREARQACGDDPRAFLLAFPFGHKLGRKLRQSPTFCLPVVDIEQDKRDALLYTDDLAEQLTAELNARVRELMEVNEMIVRQARRIVAVAKDAIIPHE